MCFVRCALCVDVVVVVDIVVVVVVVAVPVGVIVVGVIPAVFLLGSVVAEDRQIGGVFACVCNSRSKNTVFGWSEAQNHGIYDVFCLW